MKKKFLSGVLALSMLAGAGTVFAEEPAAAPADEIMLIAEPGEIVAAPQYISVTGKITAIDELITLEDETTLMQTEGLLIYDDQGKALTATDLKKDAEITAYIHANSPAPLVMPPRYQPSVIIVHTGAEQIYSTLIDCFHKAEERLAAQGGSLELNVAEETEIVTSDGEAVLAEELNGKDLLVFYSMTTRSLPPQTTPEKIIVLPAAAEAPVPEVLAPDSDTIYHSILVNGTKEIRVETDDTAVAGMVPVRAVAEALGLAVGWDSNFQAVTVGTVPMGVHFTIGENTYTKAKMTPFVLTKAPVQISLGEEGYVVTFVPIDFFTEVLGTLASVEDGILKIDIAELSVEE